MEFLADTNSVFGSNANVLRQHAQRINWHINQFFPESESYERQLLALIEEVGECVGAGRRYLGMARRAGTLEELALEMADVVITTYVLASMVDVAISPHHDISAVQNKRRVDKAAALLNLGMLLQHVLGSNSEISMHNLVAQTQAAAYLFDVNLPRVINAKLSNIYSRGWKETTPNS